MRHVRSALVLLAAAAACEAGSSAPLTGGGGRGDGTGSGGDGSDGSGVDGGTVFGGGSNCAAPHGLYELTERELTGSCDSDSFPDPTVLTTQDHTFTPPSAAVGMCTWRQTSFENTGCSFTQQIDCTNGQVSTLTCDLDTKGERLACDALFTFGANECRGTLNLARRSNPKCNPIAGVYAIEVGLFMGTPDQGCFPMTTQETDFDAFIDRILARVVGCSWLDPTFDAASCGYARESTCSGDVAIVPNIDCEFSSDATSGTCTVDDGTCVYNLTLKR